jgi:4-diphosphocytidyl-2-C-methyl-D-erythritol kinase
VRLATLAPGKVNLCLFVGRPRHDGLHPLVSIVQPVSLADEVILEPAERDEVVCPGVEGPNLAARALALFREATGWNEPVRITIAKRVPVAAGMGGGSSDAAATLRLCAAAAGVPLPRELAPRLGSDVTALLTPARTLVTGAGESVEPLSAAPLGSGAGERLESRAQGPLGPGSGEHGESRAPEPLGLVLLPSEHALSTADVYREADRLGVRDDLAAPEADIRAGARPVVNDLEPAARSLCPSIGDALAAVRALGAEHAMVSGSGPTVFGVFADLQSAREAAAGRPGALAVGPAPLDSHAVRELP